MFDAVPPQPSLKVLKPFRFVFIGRQQRARGRPFERVCLRNVMVLDASKIHVYSPFLTVHEFRYEEPVLPRFLEHPRVKNYEVNRVD